MKELYVLLGASTSKEFSNLYTKEDQKLMKSGAWDYNNSELLVNKIKEGLKNINPDLLSPEEKDWRNEVLWFWYHHAISCAIWRYKDREKAKEYSERAIFYQDEDNPNQITKLFYLLVRDNLEEAKEWVMQINDDVERDTANHLLKEYQEKGSF